MTAFGAGGPAAGVIPGTVGPGAEAGSWTTAAIRSHAAGLSFQINRAAGFIALLQARLSPGSWAMTGEPTPLGSTALITLRKRATVVAWQGLTAGL